MDKNRLLEIVSNILWVLAFFFCSALGLFLFLVFISWFR